ncbi:hypothetical protein OCU04_012141 [Sclerotinia nivalis]|uniref:Uncharacterized protein n=1 Tax=Sclerotinia nivalis TaxID=352851 RepID=A0A9X0AAH0_9HELO|nr:hypothetical protein OCU04_012141 [Sclerotinia nivalis]
MSNKATGQPAPRKVPYKTIAEEAPRYNDTPTITAYRQQAEPQLRPPYAHRVYDSTPDAALPGRAAELAQVIHEKTMEYREGYGRGEAGRIEVVALPMPEGATAEERVERCKVHYIADVSTREADWYLPGTFLHDGYQRAIIVIYRLREEWREAFNRPFEDLVSMQAKNYLDWKWESRNPFHNMNSSDWATNPHGTYLLAEWNLEISPELQAMLDEAGETMTREKVSPHALVHLDRDLARLREGIEQFYIQYAGKD